MFAEVGRWNSADTRHSILLFSTERTIRNIKKLFVMIACDTNLYEVAERLHLTRMVAFG